jgi:glycosyltransferase involved in cell wall biosynthesis
MTAHILMLSSAHPPEDKRVVLKEGASLSAAGWRVTHLCPDPIGGPRRWAAHGVAIETFRRPRGILGRALAIPRLALAARARRPDAIHCNEVDSWLAGLLARALSRPGPRVVFDVHEHYPSTFAESRFPPPLRPAVAAALRLLFRLLGPRTDRLVFAKSTVAADFPGANGVLVQNFAPRSALAAIDRPAHDAGRPLTLIHVGYVSRLRGWPQMLAALARLPVPAQLHLVGTFNDGSQADFHVTAAQLGLAGRVRHDDWMAYPDMLAACARADIGLVLFQPGVQNHVFASPHKLFDYWLAGLPVIAPGFAIEVRQVVDGAGAGLLVDPSDPAAIAAAITALADPARRAALGAAGRRAVLQHFNWEAEAAKLVAMYAALLPAPAPVPA